jgi:acyl carrier protein
MSMPTELNIEREVIRWLVDHRGTDAARIKEKNLIEERILDSMQFLDFIMYLGELVGRDISAVVSMADLTTIDSIVRFVEAQQR